MGIIIGSIQCSSSVSLKSTCFFSSLSLLIKIRTTNFKRMINRIYSKIMFFTLIDLWLFCGDPHDVNANEFPYPWSFFIQGDIKTFLVDVRKQGFVICYGMIDASVQVASKTQIPDCEGQKILKKMKPSSRYIVNMFPVIEFPTLSM